jgi:zinc transport system ATP-binding protein
LPVQSLVSLENCGVLRSGRWIARGISFAVRAGEIVTLIGPNGSGKSTSAKMALGILMPDEGLVTRNASLKVGYVPQKLSVDWTLPLTVGRFMRLTGDVAANDSADALAQTGVGKLAKSEIRNLSGGELQRVMLARAIARKPNLLVLDEPVQGVDFNGEAALYDLIRNVRDETGCGILMVSHDLHVVMAATDQVICLNGHMCCQGTPRAVASSEAYQQLFGQRASASLAIYEHHHDHEHLPDGRVAHADGSITDHCHPDDGHHHDQSKHDHADHAHDKAANHAG